ncbi:MAG: type II toxin-antitoxin system RelE/ParE family toxin [Chitinophagales bacterium]
MIVKIDKTLNKDLKKVKDKSVASKLAGIIKIIRNSTLLTDVPNIKKLKGTKNLYRIRIRDYRLGLAVEGECVELIRLLHRKDIYRYFP